MSIWQLLRTTWVSLTFWQMFIWAIYIIYTAVRTWHYYDGTGYKRKGLWTSYKEAVFCNSDGIKLYHIIVMIIDIPAVIFGYFFPVIKRVFTFNLYTFKKKESVQSIDASNTHTGS